MSEITFIEKDNEVYYSCGCKSKVIGENFIFVPCSSNCKVFKYVMIESKRKGNIISFRIEDDKK